MKLYFGYKILREHKEYAGGRMICLSWFNLKIHHDLVSSVVVFIPSTLDRAKKSREKLDSSWVLPNELPENYRAIILPGEYLMTKDLNLAEFQEDKIKDYILKNYITFEFWPEVDSSIYNKFNG